MSGAPELAREAPETVLAVLEKHVEPLHRKIRGHRLRELAAELTRREPELEVGGPERLVTQVLRMKQLAEQALREFLTIEASWQELDRRYAKQTDDRSRKQVLHDYSAATAADAGEDLEYDALRERHLIARHAILVDLEIGVTFIASAGAIAVEGAVQRGRERLVREMFESAKVEQFLRTIIESQLRWQIRRSALQGLAGFAKVARYKARDPGWLQDLRAQHLGTGVRRATATDDHEWVQGAALELVFALSDDLAIDLVNKRLFDPPQRPRDMLVRRQCVELLATGDERMRDVLRRLLVHRDPSVHVRQGLAIAFAKLGGLVELRMLAGLEKNAFEPSGQVRAVAILEACRSPRIVRDQAAWLIIDVLGNEIEALPLAIACEEVTGLAHAVTPHLAERMLEALLQVAGHPDHPPPVQENAAAAAEQLATSLADDRRQWRSYLANAIEHIEPGKRRSITLRDVHALPALAVDPMFLGRILAELSRRGFPLAATRKPTSIVVWRGDKFRKRLWRLLHELKARRPNKRQGHYHTIGRVMRGYLRAPSNILAEVTATAVPGERVLVPEEGSWGRHLPTVDDLLDLPLASREPVRIFSSHGMTTILPPGSFVRRLMNRLLLATRYEAVAALRLMSLQGTESHLRMRYVAELRDRYGIDVSFSRYDYARLPAPTPERLAALFQVKP
jgi:gamma-polyglutamate synthase